MHFEKPYESVDGLHGSFSPKPVFKLEPTMFYLGVQTSRYYPKQARWSLSINLIYPSITAKLSILMSQCESLLVSSTFYIY
jgi:hypothetical protein